MTHKKITVMCVDDSNDIVELFRNLIDNEPDMACVGTLTSADQLIIEVEKLLPSIVLLDLSMPGKDPIQALQELSTTRPETRVIVFSGYDDEANALSAVEAGGWGLISKHEEPEAVFQAIRAVASGEVVFRKSHS